mgnify:CR=1 FL=1
MRRCAGLHWGALPQSTVGGGSLLGSKKKEEAFPVNEALLNVITPMGLEIKRNSLVIGENLGKVYGAVRYPQKVDDGVAFQDHQHPQHHCFGGDYPPPH